MKKQKFRIYSLVILGGIFLGNTVMSYSMEGENNLYLRAGLGIFTGYSKFEPKMNGEKQKLTDGKANSPEYELGLEFTKNLNENVEVGIGLAYQFNSKLKEYKGSDYTSKMGKYDTLPLYIIGKYKFDSFDNGITPYLKANLGYSFNFNEKDGHINVDGMDRKYKVAVKNGLYLGFGAGIEYNNFIVDLMYQTSSAKATISGEGMKSDKDYFNSPKITLAVGYKL